MKRKKLFSVIFTLIMVAALLPQFPVFASTTEKVSFLKYDLSEHDFVNREVVCNQVIDSSEEVKWETGWYFVRGDVTIDKRVYVNGDVGLILLDGCKLECKGGIEVEKAEIGKDPQIEIFAQSTGDNKGKLIATGDEYGAGIGSDDPAVVYNTDICGDITIHGGYIEATGGNLAAGIGGGYGANGGKVTVYGGEVYATGAEYAAGIGGGYYNEDIFFINYGGKCGEVNIHGGYVKAQGGMYAAGIGGGYGSDEGDGGSVYISGGEVHADGGYGASGIGGGQDGKGGSVSVSGGEVFANGGGYASGIGGGRIGDGGFVTVSGGKVNAFGGLYAAGIGGGYYGNGGKLYVSGGEIIAGGGVETVNNDLEPAIGHGHGDEKNGTIDVSSDVRLYDNNLKEYIEIPFNKSNLTSYLSKYFFEKNNVSIKAEKGEPVQYKVYNENTGLYDIKECKDYKVLDSTVVDWNDEQWYVMDGKGNYDIETKNLIGRKGTNVIVNGNVNLILKNDCDLSILGGITVPDKSTLTIYREVPEEGKPEGRLTAGGTGLSIGAGIGSSFREKKCGTVIIHGGDITATGNTSCAGIGGYWDSTMIAGFEDYGNGGDVYIYGGKITAIGGLEAANIGAGAKISHIDNGSFTVGNGIVLIDNGTNKEVKISSTRLPFSRDYSTYFDYLNNPPGYDQGVSFTAVSSSDKYNIDFSSFTDVADGAYYADAVEWAVENNITNGTSPTTFSPKDSVTRGQVVTFLWRAAGSPEVEFDMNMTDVDAGKWYTEAVRWALSEGITKGTGENIFSPAKVCTRAEIVTLLARFAGVEDTDTETVFSDVSPDAYYAAAVKWAKDNNVTSGTTETTFSPAEVCTRAQAVTFLWRWMNK